jgi:hypothetical protein
VLAVVFKWLVRLAALPFVVLGDTVVRYPRQSAVGALVGATVLTIVINALWLQSAPHPAPLFAEIKARHAIPQPQPQPKAQPQKLQTADAGEAVAAEIAERMSRQDAADIPTEQAADTTAVTADGEASASGADAAVIPERAPMPPARAKPHRPTLASVMGGGMSGLTLSEDTRETAADRQKVTEAQTALLTLGYAQVKVDGIWGPATKSAVEAFERDYGLPVTGDINERTLRELMAVARPAGTL